MTPLMKRTKLIGLFAVGFFMFYAFYHSFDGRSPILVEELNRKSFFSISISKVREFFRPADTFESVKAKVYNNSIQNGVVVFENISRFQQELFKDYKPVIPHIIHQVWDKPDIPNVFLPWIKSIVKNHPNWEYWFWTFNDIECLYKKFYPNYLHLFAHYTIPQCQGDAARYFILHKYGGVYMDLDVEVFKPLDFWTYNYPAVLTAENFEHSHLLNLRKEYNIINNVLLSKPGHAFYKHLQNGLESHKKELNPLKKTGPFFVQDMFETYNKTEDVLVVDPRYFLPSWDITQAGTFINRCRGPKYSGLNKLAKETCEKLRKRKFTVTGRTNDSFMDHHWTHVILWKPNQKNQPGFKIKDKFPTAKLASDIIGC